jgi:hypothetical protein
LEKKMNLNDVMARLKPAARRRLQAKAQEQGLALESLIGQNLESGLIGPQDLVFVSGGVDSIWPADRDNTLSARSIWPADREY